MWTSPPPADDADTRRYELSIAGQECLLRPDSLASVGPIFDLLPAVTRVFPAVSSTRYRTGGGIAYADYALHDAQGDFNRPAYVNLLASEWLADDPRAHGTAARSPAPAWPRSAAAKVGRRSGSRRPSPSLVVDGFDNDEASIAAARKHAAEAGVGDRVRFEVVDVTADLPQRFAAGALRLRVRLRDDPRPRAAGCRAQRRCAGSASPTPCTS